MKTKLSLSALLILFVAFSCRKNPVKDSFNDGYSATPQLPATTDDYQHSFNDKLATLGRVLFYDKNLSLNNSVSCGSCHQQAKAFCDNRQFSIGLADQHTARNTPSIFAKSGRMFWDGRADGVEDLVLKPIKNHVEMRFDNLNELAGKVAGIDYYQKLFYDAFGSKFIDSTRIKKALAEFVNNFNFSNNKFNRSEMNLEPLNASEALGKTLFFGKARCSNCHHIDAASRLPGPGTPSTNPGYGSTDMDFNIGLDEVYADNGLGAITRNPADNGKFMVPVLLNVEFTAPYMHDGRFKTLEEVVEHYNSGIKNHPNLDFELRDLGKFENMTDEQIFAILDLNHDGDIDNSEIASASAPVKLNLSTGEKRSLVDFLKTLSDPHILTDTKFKDPFTTK